MSPPRSFVAAEERLQTQIPTLGAWKAGTHQPGFADDDILAAAQAFRTPVSVVTDPQTGRLGVAHDGVTLRPDEVNGAPTWPLVAHLPAIYPEWLGDRSFLSVHNLRFPYVAGAMANGIATAELVIAMAKAGMLGFFGAAGLTPPAIAAGLDTIEAALSGTGLTWGSNLIHAPQEPQIEKETVDMYLKRGVTRVSASAYMGLNPLVVRYAYSGVRRLGDGSVFRKNHVFAKISRPEVARRFLAPAPDEILDELVRQGGLTRDEADIARTLPVAEDITAESDSGGHTDNRPLSALFPMIVGVRDEMMTTYNYARPIRVGAAGGMGTPSSVAAAFQLGAAYVLTGSVNQSAVEAGLSDHGKRLLCQASLADVVMAPAADMFELGVCVQVLQRGTMFGPRAQKLYEHYQAYESLEAMPADVRGKLENEVLGAPLDQIWEGCEAFFSERDPAELERAQKDAKHKMALVFRWYLGLSSRWAIQGQDDRKMDYQIWCGPAMGAFNAWVKGTFLEPPESRTAPQIAYNLLEGAAAITRAQQLRSQGVAVPPQAFSFAPRPLRA